MRRVDRWLVNPVFGVLMRRQSRKALRRLGEIFTRERQEEKGTP
jgi:hypothetical protein